ncbi:MAG: helix-turn-helix transcriptional regulator [Conexibacter sp.]|jgi:DNA-binding CsgD family transcriptional regulator|nr:helix-turn-helix transcriptional regulator [Conexibacter sp.]
MKSRRISAVRDGGLATIARVAATAASGASVQDRAQQTVDELQALIPMENALLSCLVPGTGARSVVVNNGYSERLVTCLNGGDYHAELVEPFALPNNGWPVRENELPVDPLSLRCVAEYFRPAGLRDGLMCALVTGDGRYVGFLDMSSGDAGAPSDEACAVVGHLAPTLATLVDPLQSARRLASTLDDRATMLGLLPDGQLVALQGGPVPEELMSREPELRAVLARMLAGDRPAAGFLWPDGTGGWHRCRAFRCRDGTTVVAVTTPNPPLELTRRELEVLTHLAQGRANAEIADDLGVVVRTVKAHVEHILEKLAVPTRTAAVVRAIEDGLLLPKAG